MPADRNLLFGILALKLDFITRDQLVAAMNVWILAKSNSLGEILAEQGVLSSPRVELIDRVVEEHLRAHSDETRLSLHSLRVDEDVLRTLASLPDEGVQQTLTAIPDEGAPVSPGHPRVSPGQRYTIMRAHAKGGIGEVFIAYDGELKREVALKEIQQHRAHDSASRARFLQEAEITAGLEHPGVVPIYGLGSYADGRPYYAMRFIRGDSLLQAIKRFHADGSASQKAAERALALRGLLLRFVDVCNAMAYAHSRGVLHRDLKPGNVMLGKYGETLVVDWGLAKAMGEVESQEQADTAGPLVPSSGSGMTPTSAGAALGTLGYMSPEQAAGRLDELGVPSDIYSLGATLYHLLVGRPSISTGEVKEGARRIQEGNIPSPTQLNAAVPPALEAICLKAMALAPGDRYHSALDLAGDVDRYLADEPVSAYREPWVQRWGRHLRHHRTAAVSAAVLLVCAVIGLSVTTLIVWRSEHAIAREKGIAQENYLLARELSYSGFALVELAHPQLGSAPDLKSDRRKLLEAASRAFRKYHGEQPDDFDLKKQTAKVYRYTAHVQSQEGDVQHAEPLVADAIQLHRELIAAAPAQADLKEKLAEVLRDSSQVQIKKGHLRAAAANLQESVALSEEVMALEPERPGHQRALATTLLDLAADENACGEFAVAATTGTRAAEMFRDLSATGASPYDPLLRAAALNQAGGAFRESGAIGESHQKLEESVKLLEAMNENVPKNVTPRDVQFFLAQARLELGRSKASTSKQVAMAEDLMTSAVDLCIDLTVKYPTVPRYQQVKGQAYQARGQLLQRSGRLDEAIRDLDKSLGFFKTLAATSQDPADYSGDSGRTRLALGHIMQSRKKDAEAARYFQEAITDLTRALDQSPERFRDQRSFAEAQAAKRSLAP